MFTKIALLSAAGLLAVATSVTTYMGMSSQGSDSGGCCSKATSCCQTDMASCEVAKSPCDCDSCVCSKCLPEDCCCKDCCADGVCCDGTACDCCGAAATKLISTAAETGAETCTSGCCSKK